MTTLEKPTQEAVSDAAPVETAAGQVVPEAAPAGAQPGPELLWGFFNDETDIKLCRWGFVAGVGVVGFFIALCWAMGLRMLP